MFFGRWPNLDRMVGLGAFVFFFCGGNGASAKVAPGTPGSIRALAAGLSNSDSCRRLVSVDALSRIRDKRVEGLQLRAAADRTEAVRLAALGALCRRKTSRAPALVLEAVRRAPKLSFHANFCLKMLGKTAVAALIRAMKHRSAVVRRQAIGGLKEIGDPRAVTPLLAALTDPDPKVRLESALAFGKFREPKALEPLRKMLKDTAEIVREGAVWAVGEFRKRKTIPWIEAALRDRSSKVRTAAVHALRTLGRRAVKALVRALKTGTPEVRLTAAAQLGKLGGRRAVKALKRASREGSAKFKLAVCTALKERRVRTRRCEEMFDLRKIGKVLLSVAKAGAKHLYAFRNATVGSVCLGHFCSRDMLRAAMGYDLLRKSAGDLDGGPSGRPVPLSPLQKCRIKLRRSGN